MTIRDLESLPDTRLVQPDGGDVPVLRAAYTSDLLSDVMAHAPADSVLITMQAHANTVAVATLVRIRAIFVCHNRPIPPDMLVSARRERIAIAVSPLSQYEASWRIQRRLDPDIP